MYLYALGIRSENHAAEACVSVIASLILTVVRCCVEGNVSMMANESGSAR
jgi:hypothetical protein